MHAQMRHYRLLRSLGFVAYGLVAVSLLLLVLEYVVRRSFPLINHQDTEGSLFLPPAAGQSLVRWRPATSGVSFGELVKIDEYGYRDLQSVHSAPNSSWLLVGDSVTFGVGVNANDTFAGRLQAANPGVKVWNTAVVGYNIQDHLEVIEGFLAKPHPPDLVILFFCLNDPDSRLQLPTGRVSLPENLLGLLRRHSKLYLLLKGTLADRSKIYFLNDLAFYDATNPDFQQTTRVLGKIHTLLSQANIPFLVAILPYEYQVRHRGEMDLVPQRLLGGRLHALGIPTMDLYDVFATSGRPSSELFLYADPMHLSRWGHELVFRAVSSWVDGTDPPGRRAGARSAGNGPSNTR